MEKTDFLALAVKAAEVADNKKAADTIILDVHKTTVVTNYFVIATAESTPQIDAISNEIEKTFKEQDVKSLRRQGMSSSLWRVIDYGGIIVHVMSPEIRELYKLEKLWDNAEVINHKILKVKKGRQVGLITKNLQKQKLKKENQSVEKK